MRAGGEKHHFHVSFCFGSMRCKFFSDLCAFAFDISEHVNQRILNWNRLQKEKIQRKNPWRGVSRAKRQENEITQWGEVAKIWALWPRERSDPETQPNYLTIIKESIRRVLYYVGFVTQNTQCLVRYKQRRIEFPYFARGTAFLRWCFWQLTCEVHIL